MTFKSYRQKRSLDSNVKNQGPKKQKSFSAPKAKFRVTGNRTGIDSKYLDTTIDKNWDSAGDITHVSAIAQGNTINDRDARACRLKSCWIRLYGAVGASINTCATYLVWDNQPNKVLPAISDIFLPDPTAVGFPNDFNAKSLPNRENAGRFVILKKDLRATPTTSGGAGVIIDEYVTLPDDCVCQYTLADTTGVITNCISGALYLVTMGELAAPGMFAKGVVRTNFVDV